MTDQAPPMVRSDKIVQWVSILCAGGVAALIAYLEWRGVLGVSMQPPHLGISLDPSVKPKTIPWAPWWVVPSLVAPLAMLLWPLTGVLSGRVRWLRAAAVMAFVAIAVIPMAAIVLQVSAVLQLDPSFNPLLIAFGLPVLFPHAIKITAVILAFHGIALVPFGALMGLMLAALTRVATRCACGVRGRLPRVVTSHQH